jgi:hypothetical protein
MWQLNFSLEPLDAASSDLSATNKVISEKAMKSHGKQKY